MLTVLRQSNFTLLWVAQLISMTGDLFLFIALPFHIYRVTGSSLATGLMFICQTLPGLLFGSIAGVFADRLDRKYTMVVADLSRAILLCIIPIAVRSSDLLWLIYVAVFLETAISQFFSSAKNAVIPDLVNRDDLIAANSLVALSSGFATVVGPSIGGVLLFVLGFNGLVILDVVSYLGSALMISLVRISHKPVKFQELDKAQTTIKSELKTFQNNLVEGFRFIRGSKLISTVLLMSMFATLARGLLSVLLVIFVEKVLRGGEIEFGLVVTAQAAGGICGSLITGFISKWISSNNFLIIGAGGAGLTLLTIVNLPILWLVLLGMFVAGLLLIGWTINEELLMQKTIPNQYRGRVFGTFGSLDALMSLFGMGAASVLNDIVGVTPLLNLAGILFVSVGIIAFIGLPKETL
jgi:MFS family permease